MRSGFDALRRQLTKPINDLSCVKNTQQIHMLRHETNVL